jgi:ParB family chromosome partitioning protein
MDQVHPTKSRLQLVKEMAEHGELGKTSLSPTGRKIVNIDKLVEDPDNERKTYDDMADLIASVKNHGIVEPPTVMLLPDGRYQIVTGHRRYRAAKEAGLPQIEVIIREPEEKWERRKKSLISNVQRKDVRPIELALALKALLDNDPGLQTQDDLAETIGKDKTWVSRMLRILDLPDDLREKVATSQLFVPADAVSNIARLEDRQTQENLIDELLTGATTRDIRSRINEHKAKAPAEVREKPAPKPKRVFYTGHNAFVIVQSEHGRLTHHQVIDALAEALKQARRDE